jgi:FkbM family methyltransferase
MAMTTLDGQSTGPSAGSFLERVSFGAALERLPARLRRAIVRALAGRSDYPTLQALGRRAGIHDVSLMGDCGLIQGSLDDTSVLATYARTRTWRPALAQFFGRYFEDEGPGLFIDVGANIGLTTIPIARLAGTRCLAFEPDPESFHYLRHNIEANCPQRNVALFKLALFDSAGRLDFRRSVRDKGDHHLSRGEEPADREAPSLIRVPTARLDDVLSPHLVERGAPLAAKIVAQGAETQIVAGGTGVLARAGALMIEVFPQGIERLQGDFRGLLRFCSDNFAWAALNTGEHDGICTWMRVDDIVPRLRDRYDAALGHSAVYHHLFLRK